MSAAIASAEVEMNDIRLTTRNRRLRRRPLGQYFPCRCLRLRQVACIVACAVAFGFAIYAVAMRRHTARPVKNVIFMVSDGFGPSSLTFARMFFNVVNSPEALAAGAARPLHLDGLTRGLAHTYSADSLITDSAAGATAWSCAMKTYNHAIGVEPRHARPCATLMEAAKAAGMATGIVVTSSVTDATPAAFTTHVPHRNMQLSIALQYATNQTADVVLGGGRGYFEPQELVERMRAEGYEYVYDRDSLMEVDAAPVLGLFADHHMPWEIDRDPSTTPSLTEMATKAIELLSTKGGDRGFFLLVEGSKIDKAAHPNDPATHLREILAYDEAVGAMLEQADQLGQTVVLSTSDHETGGLAVGRGMYNHSGTLHEGGARTGARCTLITVPGLRRTIITAVCVCVRAAELEAPLHTRDLRAEAEGLATEDYRMILHLEVLRVVSASSEAMVDAALRSVGDPEAMRHNLTSTMRDELVAQLALELRNRGGLDAVRPDEDALLREAVGLYHELGSYGIIRAMGSILSARAGVGWSTWGHTGTDVTVHAHGLSDGALPPTMENTDVGQLIAQLMGFNLTALTQTLGEPLISPLDRDWIS
jgi:alkaline phosphatase